MTDPYSKVAEQSARSQPPRDQPPPLLTAPTSNVRADCVAGVITAAKIVGVAMTASTQLPRAQQAAR